MHDLSYFNLGVRSDRVYNSLLSFRETENSDIDIMQEAITIIQECLEIDDEDKLISNLSNSDNYGIDILAPILWEVFPNESISTVMKELKKVFETLLLIKNKPSEKPIKNLKKTVSFFEKVAEISLAHGTALTFQQNPAII